MKKIGLFDKIKGKSSSTNKDKKHLHHKSVGEAPSNSSQSKSMTAASSQAGHSVQAVVNSIHMHCKLNDNGSIQTIDMKKLP